MMSVSIGTLLAGMGVGLAVAVPIGPMGILCIQRTLSFGMVAGLATGLGAATVHLGYGWAAALGLGATTATWLGTDVRFLPLVSAALLFIFAARLFTRCTSTRPSETQLDGWAYSYASACLFGLTNPLTILLFTAAIPALAHADDFKAAPHFAFGVFLGSILWWTVLSTIVTLIRSWMTDTMIEVASKASGFGLAMLGAVMLGNALGLTLR